MMAAVASACVRCGSDLVAGQEYCLTCGQRRPGPGRLGTSPPGRGLLLPLAALGAVALGGAALAIALTREPSQTVELVTATGGSVTVTAPARPTGTALATWPPGVDAWTIVLVSVPKVQGRNIAAQVARTARAGGLRRVGVLDSSRFASLHPGYWLVFAGRYRNEPEATGGLQRARAVARTARVQRVAG